MIKISLCYLAIVHISIVLYFTNIIGSGTLIALFYILNIIPALFILQREYLSHLLNFDGETPIIKQTDEPFEVVEKENSETVQSSNLYIQRWQKKVLTSPMQYPLDRLAYLKGKHYSCDEVINFRIQNSHLKQLVTKGDYRPHEKYDDDPHPSKMVNDLLETYVHRRAHLYRQRKTIIVDRTQRTAHRRKRFSIRSILQSMSVRKRSDDAEATTPPRIQESIPVVADEESSSDEEEPVKPRKLSFWRRLSNPFRRSSSVQHSREELEDSENTDYEEYL